MRTKKKNKMRTPEEKEKLVLEFFNSGIPYRSFADKYDIYPSLFHKWITKYRKNGIDGLRSKTGKGSHPGSGNHLSGLQNKKNKTKEEELQLKVLQLEIQVARLKKGYQVKGVGTKKEFVTIKDLNTKS